MPIPENRVEQVMGELRTIRQGERLVDRMRIGRALLHAHLHLGKGRRLLSWLPKGDDAPKEIRMRSGVRLLVRPQDGIVLYEHFGADVYDEFVPAGDVATVVDLGANVGYAAVVLAKRLGVRKLVCVEPADETRALLARNLALNGIEADVLGVAIVGENGRVDLDPAHYSANNRVAPAEDGAIEGITLDQLLDRTGIDTVDLLKIDIEGAEREVFARAESWANRVRAVVGELHDGLTVDDVASDLAPYGFEPVPVSDGLCAYQRVGAPAAAA